MKVFLVNVSRVDQFEIQAVSAKQAIELAQDIDVSFHSKLCDLYKHGGRVYHKDTSKYEVWTEDIAEGYTLGMQKETCNECA
jgi:hypothetical protein